MLRFLPCLFLAIPGMALFHVPQSSADSDGESEFLVEGEAKTSEECSALTNVEGTHYIISVLAGSPPQRFKLIPDTGSPWIIVADSNCSVCSCGPHKDNKCFHDERSMSLDVPMLDGEPAKQVLTFGSGPITVAVASDMVKVEGTHIAHYLERGVLLMIDNGLTFSGPFEGLFGLGLPEYKLDASVTDDHPAHTYTDGFLHKAGVKNFSICLSDKGWSGSGGIIRFGAPGGSEHFGITHDTMHWQVAFHGGTVGTSKKPLDFCLNAMDGDKSPCAAVIDSGTTYMLGPHHQIHALYDGLCDQWERCKTKFAKLSSSFTAVRKFLNENKTDSRTDVTPPQSLTKSDLFQVLLNNCGDWMKKKSGLEELSALNLNIRGRSGNQGILQLQPWDYIVSQEDFKMDIVYESLNGVRYATGLERKNSKVWACMPAFATMDFPTKQNGPAWIFGLPVFYAYSVSYNGETNPPSMSFMRETCSSCTKKSRAFPRWKKNSLQTPRKMHGEPHLPMKAQKMQLTLLKR